MKFICKKCNHIKEICLSKDLTLDIEEFNCPFCNVMMNSYDEQEKIELLENIAQAAILKGMRKNIDTIGNDKTWELIERNFPKPEQRIKFRKFFFLAGGKLPNKEIKKEDIC